MWLDRLVGAARERVDQGYYEARPSSRLKPHGSLRASVQRAYPALVAEIKPGRPTGEPRDVDVAKLAQAYAEGGACGISVLTDPDHFGGRLQNLELARQPHVPLLMKDFVVDEAQVDAAATWGASAVLAIARLHTEGYTDTSLADLVDRAHELDIEILAEVVTDEELDLALGTDADLVGINVRDLDTLEIDPDRPRRLLEDREIDPPVLHLSGIETAEDVADALAAGADGVLVGTSLMSAQDPRQATRDLLEAPR